MSSIRVTSDKKREFVAVLEQLENNKIAYQIKDDENSITCGFNDPVILECVHPSDLDQFNQITQSLNSATNAPSPSV